jgi:hypothetical protein
MVNRYDIIASRITMGKGAMIIKGGCDDYGRGVRCIMAPDFVSHTHKWCHIDQLSSLHVSFNLAAADLGIQTLGVATG